MSEGHDIDTVVFPDYLIPEFEQWLDSKGLYLSAPVRLAGEPDPEGELNRFIWPKDR